MPILLDKNKKVDLGSPDKEVKLCAYAKTTTTVTEKEVARQVAHRTTITPKEAEMVIAHLKEVVIENILHGRTVMLGDWGYFCPSVTCELAPTKEELNRNKIKRVKMHLRLNKNVEQALQEAKFLFIEDLINNPDPTEE